MEPDANTPSIVHEMGLSTNCKRTIEFYLSQNQMWISIIQLARSKVLIVISTRGDSFFCTVKSSIFTAKGNCCNKTSTSIQLRRQFVLNHCDTTFHAKLRTFLQHKRLWRPSHKTRLTTRGWPAGFSLGKSRPKWPRQWSDWIRWSHHPRYVSSLFQGNCEDSNRLALPCKGMSTRNNERGRSLTNEDLTFNSKKTVSTFLARSWVPGSNIER